jgi:hypothetical protein
MPHIDRSNSGQQELHKRPYTKPLLVKHGDLRDITLTVGAKGKLDNPKLGAMKTSL